MGNCEIDVEVVIKKSLYFQCFEPQACFRMSASKFLLFFISSIVQCNEYVTHTTPNQKQNISSVFLFHVQHFH